MVGGGLEEVDRPRERISRAGGGDDDGVVIHIVVSTMQPFVAGTRSERNPAL